MHIERQTKESVSLLLSTDEAQQVLSGLQAHADELGEPGQALADALRAADVAPSNAPANVRYEWP